MEYKQKTAKNCKFCSKFFHREHPQNGSRNYPLKCGMTHILKYLKYDHFNFHQPPLSFVATQKQMRTNLVNLAIIFTGKTHHYI